MSDPDKPLTDEELATYRANAEVWPELRISRLLATVTAREADARRAALEEREAEVKMLRDVLRRAQPFVVNAGKLDGFEEEIERALLDDAGSKAVREFRPKWAQDAPDHWSARLKDGRYLSAWPKGFRWKWAVLSADGEATVLVDGTEDYIADAQEACEKAAAR